jgi:putative transposase
VLAVDLAVPRALCVDVGVDGLGDRGVGAARLVLVDQRGPLAVVAHPGHQVLDARAACRRERSVRDVEAALAEALGDQAAISKLTVSLVCQQIKDEYQAWARAASTRSASTTCSWTRASSGCIPARRQSRYWPPGGITTGGKPAFIGLAPGPGESADAWHDFLADLKDRGLGSPLLVISDGAPGLISAIEQAFPQALRQRCLIHRARNVLAKNPAGMQPEIKDAYRAIFDTEDLKTAPGPKLTEMIDARIGAFADRYRATYPAAVKILLTDRAGLTAYLRFPAEHHNGIRHSNFIERAFGETRVKVIGRLPGETSCLTLVWAVLGRASAGRRGLTMTSDGLRLLQDLRRSLLEPPRQLHARIDTATELQDQPQTVRATA